MDNAEKGVKTEIELIFSSNSPQSFSSWHECPYGTWAIIF